MKSSEYIKCVCSFLIFFQRLQAVKVNYKNVSLTADYEPEEVKNDLGSNSDDIACQRRGILVQSIQIVLYSKRNCSGQRYKDLKGPNLNAIEKRLVEIIHKECNGRIQCKLQETWKVKPSLNCNGSLLPADRIVIKGQCLETEMDNKTVYGFQEIQELSLKNKIYLISRNEELDRVCQLSGNENDTRLTILHFHYDTPHSSNKSSLISIKDKSSNIAFCFESGNITNKGIAVRNATIIVTMGRGFFWILLEAESATNLSCEDRNTSVSTCEDFEGTELTKSNIYESISSIGTTIAISFGIVLSIPIIICLLLGIISFRKRKPVCNVCVKVKKCEILTRKKQSGQRSNKENTNISPKMLMKRNIKAESESCQQTQNPKDCIYFQLEKSLDTDQFNLTDDTNKSMSWDESKEDVNVITRLESDYSHLHFSSRQKLQNCENIYSG